MLVVDQTGTRSIPFENFPFEIVPYSSLYDVEPEIQERFKRENLWYTIIAQVGFEDVRIMGGYDTFTKAKRQMAALALMYQKGAKIVQLDYSHTLNDDLIFNVNEAMKKILF